MIDIAKLQAIADEVATPQVSEAEQRAKAEQWAADYEIEKWVTIGAAEGRHHVSIDIDDADSPENIRLRTMLSKHLSAVVFGPTVTANHVSLIMPSDDVCRVIVRW